MTDDGGACGADRVPRPLGPLHGAVRSGHSQRRREPDGCSRRRPGIGEGGVGRQRSTSTAKRVDRWPTMLPAIDLTLRHAAGLSTEAAHLPVQPADPGRRPEAADRSCPQRHGGQELLHAARQRLSAQQEEPDGAGVPQVPREGRALAAGADPRLGAHDDGARVSCAAPARSRLRRLVPARQAAVGRAVAGASAAAGSARPQPAPGRGCCGAGVRSRPTLPSRRAQGRRRACRRPCRWGGRTPPTGPAGAPRAAASADPKEDIPLSLLLDEAGDGASSILAGRALRSNKSITLNKDVLKRHAAVLGGSGSGKTTLALCIIEQLLLRGTPAVLIDRKGDLCSYANPDVWRALEGEFGERRGRAREAGRFHRRCRLHARPGLGPSDLDHAAAQRHQRAARAGAAAARQPVGGGARRHAASEELGHAPEAVGHAVRGAAHPRRPLQQGGDARRPDRRCWRTRTPS